MVFVGIDNGYGTSSYGIIKKVDGKVVDIYAGRVNSRWLFAQLGNYQNCGEKLIVTIEKAWGFPKIATSAVFNYGLGYGKVLSVFEILDAPYNLVVPSVWKKHFGLTKDKTLSIAKIKELYPNVNLYFTNKCKKEDHNLAEALLIAEYGRKIYE